MIHFCLTAQRTKLPRRFRKRLALHNSRLRMNVSGYANLERWWLLGWDVTIQWGVFRSDAPQWGYTNGRKIILEERSK